MRQFDLLTIHETTVSFKTLNGKIISRQQSDLTKKGLRKFQDGCVYYFNYFGELGDEEFIQRSLPYPGTGLPLNYDLLSWQSRSFLDEKSQALTLENLESELLAVEEHLGPFLQDFNLQGTYLRTQQMVTLADDQGQSLQAQVVNNSNLYEITQKGSSSIMDGFFINERLGLSPEYHYQSLYGILEKYFEKAVIADGEYPVLFAIGSYADEMLLAKVKHSLIADTYFQQAGLLSGKLGAEVFSKDLSLVDTNQCTELGVYAPFDREGMVRARPDWTLIEQGVVKNLVADLRLASKYQLPPTGNSDRSYQSATTTAYNCVKVLPGVKSTQEILQSLPICIVVLMSFGGDFTDLGDFSTPVDLCYLYRYGERIGKLDPITVKSSVQKMLGDDLIAVASDNFLQSASSPSLFCKMQIMNN